MKYLVLTLLLFSVIPTLGGETHFECHGYLAEIAGGAHTPPHIHYVNLIRHLALEKNVIDIGILETLAKGNNPLDIKRLPRLTSVELFVYKNALSRIMKSGGADVTAHWPEIKIEIESFITELSNHAFRRTQALNETEFVPLPITVKSNIFP